MALTLEERFSLFEELRRRPLPALGRALTEDEQREFVLFRLGPRHPEFGSAFLRYFLPHYCSEEDEDGRPRWVPFADWHADFFRCLFGSLGTGQWHAYLAPRGYGKSTIAAVATPLAVLGLSGLAIQGKLPYRFRPRHYLWLVQDTASQARQSMDAILQETEQNPRIRRWFPHLVPALGRHRRPIADRDDDVVFELGLRLQALGAGQKLRGRRHRQHRPDLVIVDDLENDQSVLTRYQRDKLDRWLSTALAFAVAKGADVHLLGTLLHSDSVLARVLGRGGWDSHRYQAFADEEEPCPDHGFRVDPADTSLPECDLCAGRGRVRRSTWPHRDHRWHALMRRRVGVAAYNREILHLASDEERKRFPARLFRYGERPQGPDVSCRIGVDPAVGERREHDLSALVVALKRRGERRFHVDYAWAARVRGKRLRAQIVQVYGEYKALGYQPVVVFERVQAQAWGMEELEDAGVPVDPYVPVVDKLTRAEPVALHYEQERVTHAGRLRGSDFEACLDAFPDGEHDDYVDALVMAILRLEEAESGAGLTGAVTRMGRSRAEPEPYDPRYA